MYVKIIDEVLQSIDGSTKPFKANNDIFLKLDDAIKKLPEEEQLNFSNITKFADYFAFSFQIHNNDISYCLPLTNFYVDKLETDTFNEIIIAWESRVNTLTRPTLIGRYADVLWSTPVKRKNSKAMALIAINSYLLSIDKNDVELNSELYETHIARALKLAISIKNLECVQKIKQLAIDNINNERNSFNSVLFSLLISPSWSKAKLTLDEKRDIILKLEQLVEIKTKSRENFDPFCLVKIKSTLFSLYDSAQMQGHREALINKIASSYIEFPYLLEREYLPLAYQWCIDVKLTALSKKIDQRIMVINKRDEANIVPIRYSFDVGDEMIAIENTFKDLSIEEALLKFSENFIINKNEAHMQFNEFCDNPTLSLLSIPVFEDGKVLAKSNMQDEQHALIHFVKLILLPRINTRIVNAMITIFKNGNINDSALSNWVNNLIFLEKSEKFLLYHAFSRVLSCDYIAAIHLLLPQIEVILRRLCVIYGGAPSKPGKQGGTTISKSLGELLKENEVSSLFGEDINFYFDLLFVSDFGLDLRNKVLHGHMPINEMDIGNVALVFHAILIIIRIGQTIEDRSQ